MAAEDVRDERDEGDAHQEKDVEPEQVEIRPFDDPENVVMAQPSDPEEDETRRVHDEARAQVCQRRPEFVVGHIANEELDCQQGHRDGEHAVRKGL